MTISKYSGAVISCACGQWEGEGGRAFLSHRRRSGIEVCNREPTLTYPEGGRPAHRATRRVPVSSEDRPPVDRLIGMTSHNMLDGIDTTPQIPGSDLPQPSDAGWDPPPGIVAPSKPGAPANLPPPPLVEFRIAFTPKELGFYDFFRAHRGFTGTLSMFVEQMIEVAANLVYNVDISAHSYAQPPDGTESTAA